ncbi:MAG: PadR family transcriptional regulator [Alphaproteobacteria bacterium]
MTKSRASLTELEGAILGLLRRAPGLTAYRIRQLFLASKSAEWSGSAGAVYPAIRRLEAAKLARATKTGDARGSLTYELTPKGTGVLESWMGDTARAISPGMDPFRTRSALWKTLPKSDWRALRSRLAAAIEGRLAAIKKEMPNSEDELDRVTLGLEQELQEMRLAWLKRN